MLVASDYPFLDLMWTILIVFMWIIWIMLLFYVIADVFRRHDIGGGKKAVWLIFVIVAVFLGVLVYVIVNGQGMAERNARQARNATGRISTRTSRASPGRAGRQPRSRRRTACSTSGAITQAEFDAIKAKALS